ncbi:unnamed protein product [Timema podura]|nr:unnamed protein product [Timema podura]
MTYSSDQILHLHQSIKLEAFTKKFLTKQWTLYERLTVECDSTLNCLGRVRNLQLLMQYV